MARLDPPIGRRVVRKLESAASDPDRYFLALVGSDERKLRIGDYRLLALLDPTTRTILIERVDHRSRVYR
ncbi:MAG: type II toxin-antitoxin system RelE/ParE family toxin [Thermoplasmata archaeon]|nr:type II toxin-antitoxin system RelE/ParE family toxin [Thermoplasmata archaeon]